MKKIFATVVALVLISSLSFAQETGGDKKGTHKKSETKATSSKAGKTEGSKSSGATPVKKTTKPGQGTGSANTK